MSRDDIAELTFVLGIVLSLVYTSATILIVTVCLYVAYAIWHVIKDIHDEP